MISECRDVDGADSSSFSLCGDASAGKVSCLFFFGICRTSACSFRCKTVS